MITCIITTIQESKLFNVKYEKMSSIDLERFINEIAEKHTPNVANQALKK